MGDRVLILRNLVIHAVQRRGNVVEENPQVRFLGIATADRDRLAMRLLIGMSQYTATTLYVAKYPSAIHFSAQQDKERTRMARQKQEMGEQPLSAFSLTPATTMFKYLVGGIAPIVPRDYQSQFTLSDQQNSTASPNYQMQMTVFDRQNRTRLNMARQ